MHWRQVALEDAERLCRRSGYRGSIRCDRHRTNRIRCKFHTKLTTSAYHQIFQELLGQTDDYPETLKDTIESIRNSIPVIRQGRPISKVVSCDLFSTFPFIEYAHPASIIQSCLDAQDRVKASMAVRLEDLTRHYNQMAKALGESKTGSGSDIFIEEDIKGKLNSLLPANYMGSSNIHP